MIARWGSRRAGYWYGVWILAILALLVLTAPAATGQVLRVGSGVADVGTLDPHFASNFGEYPIVKAIFNGLVDFPAGSVDLEAIEPDLAQSWEVSPDGLTWTFHLRQGVQFHSGYGELTAEDVVFSLKRVQSPEVGSPWRSELANIADVRALDRYTVEISLRQPDPFALLRLVGYHAGFIVSKRAVEELGDQFRFNPIGTGPFAFASYEPRQKVSLVAHTDYFKGAPALSGIDFYFMPDTSTRELALRTREIDAADGNSEQVWYDRMRRQGLVVDRIGPGNAYHLHYNMTIPPFDNILVRQALSYAVNRQEVVEFVGPDISQVSGSPVPNGYYGHTTEGVPQYDYDPEKARELLAEAGFPNGFSFEVFISEASSYLPFAQIVQEQWRRVGVDMRLQVVDHATFHARVREDTNPVVFYNATRLPIADVYLSQFYHSDAVVGKPTAITNFSHIGEVTPGVDELIEAARVETDPEKQLELYAEAQRRIMEEAVAYPYMQRYTVMARQPYVDLGYEEPMSNLWAHYVYNERTRLLDR